MARYDDHLAIGDVVAATTTWPVLLPVFVGLLGAYIGGHVMAHLTVKAVAVGMDMTSRAGHRRYYRVDREFRHGRYTR